MERKDSLDLFNILQCNISLFYLSRYEWNFNGHSIYIYIHKLFIRSWLSVQFFPFEIWWDNNNHYITVCDYLLIKNTDILWKGTLVLFGGITSLIAVFLPEIIQNKRKL